jgi:hypothetical protein
MTRYRYRTPALVGPWRSTSRQAARDAIRSKQARAGEADESLIWLVPGEIETTDERGTSPKGNSRSFR